MSAVIIFLLIFIVYSVGILISLIALIIINNNSVENKHINLLDCFFSWMFIIFLLYLFFESFFKK